MTFKQKLIVGLVTTLVWFLHKSVRWQYIGSGIHPAKTPCVFSVWHNRLLMMPVLFKGWVGPGIISDHSDGELIASVFNNFGMQASRGSSSKGGARALLKVIRQAQAGNSPGVTPDGPRGPIYITKPGAAQIALKAGLPVVPACYATNRQWRLNSWDKFYVPKPFSKGVVVVGDAIYAQTDESLESFTNRVQLAMVSNQEQADNYFQ